jgi:serine/threonine protein kinase
VSIEDFSILKVLGTGSYGKVQLVRNKGDTKLYAMKSLKKQELARQRQLVHTQTEYNIAFNHSHRYLVNLVFAFQVMVM